MRKSCGETRSMHPGLRRFPGLCTMKSGRMKKNGRWKKAKAAAFLMKGLPMIPLTKFPMKDMLNRYDVRAQIMLNYFKHAILPSIPKDYLSKTIEETAFISEENAKSVENLSDSGIEVHIGSTGTPKEVIERHLEINGLKDYVSSVVGNPMRVNDGIKFNVRYADRKGKYDLMEKIRGNTPYENLAIIDDEPDVAGIALKKVSDNGGLVRIMKSRKEYDHPYLEVRKLGEFVECIHNRNDFLINYSTKWAERKGNTKY